MPTKTLQSIGGKACHIRHGTIFYKKIAQNYWNSSKGQARRKALKEGKIKVKN